MDIRLRRIALAGSLIVVTGLGSALAAGAVPAPPPTVTPSSADLSPGMLDAMQRDLGLDEEEARLRLGQQHAASTINDRLTSRLGGDMVGSYFEPSTGTLVVNLHDERRADEVRRAGAEPRVVPHSAATLSAAVDRLARAAAPGEVASWYVDQRTNTVLVSAMPGRGAHARALVDRADVSRDLVTFREAGRAPRPVVDLRGGDSYSSAVGKCSVGFPVTDQQGTPGFITAGHCSIGGTGPDVYIGGEHAGKVVKARFPGDMDAGLVSSPGHNPTALVNDYEGGAVTVTGTKETLVNGSICRSGDTSGWHCGTIVAKDVTVDYGDMGKVTGLTKTDTCATPGDSGGTVLTGDQLQGVASGVDGTCEDPLPPGEQAFYYQEATEILTKWELTPAVQG